ncbi:major facilitator superfamily domain-containing protein 4A-like [Branchiostoma floridae]|uniref:Major facilitator superfamily domain-containing protein 4A-like n=1 Tax=Branchiostoma floridae TaxID=7739 RepID=A0A9J7L6Z2_BRAFL|nr:major facilitator superfamily domain-containing protein 4A-like [Branchiostoma floridae]
MENGSALPRSEGEDAPVSAGHVAHPPAKQNGNVAKKSNGKKKPEEKKKKEETTPTKTVRLKDNWQSTFTYCSVFLSFGTCVAFLGPTLLDLGCLTRSSLGDMTWAFFAQSLSLLVGSTFGGLLVERFSGNPTLLVAVVTVGVTLSVIPLCRTLWILTMVLAIMGVAMGCIDTVANVQLIRIYSHDVSPFLQALHFCYGLGAFISPMVAEPFILDQDCDTFLNVTYSNDSFIRDLMPSEGVDPTGMNNVTKAESLDEAIHKTEVRYAFWIMASLNIPIAFAIMLLLIHQRNDGKHRGKLLLREGVKEDIMKSKRGYEDIVEAEHENEREHEGADESGTLIGDEKKEIPASKLRTVVVTMLTATLLFLFDGIQAAFAGWIYAYAVISKVDLGSRYAAYLTGAFWGSLALGRLVSIPIATKLQPPAMLMCNLVGGNFPYLALGRLVSIPIATKLQPPAMLMFPNHNPTYPNPNLTGAFWGSLALGRLVSIPIATKLQPPAMLMCNLVGCLAAILVIQGMPHSPMALYAGAMTFGFFLSSIYPSSIAMAERNVRVTGGITSALVIGAATGEMVLPVLVGRLFVWYGPPSFVVSCCVVAALGMIVFCTLWFYASVSSTTQKQSNSQPYWWCRWCCSKRDTLLNKGPTSYYTVMDDTVELASLPKSPISTEPKSGS